MDEYGHVVGDTHEPEPNAVASRGAGPGRKRSGYEAGGGPGGKRQKRSTSELLAGGGRDSSGSDLQSQPGAPPALAAGVVDEASPMDVGPAAAVAQQPGAAVAPAAGIALAQAASPSKVLDTYTAFNLAAQPAWNPPPVSVGSLPSRPLEIPGLRINAKPSSLLPPPAQVRRAAPQLPY